MPRRLRPFALMSAVILGASSACPLAAEVRVQDPASYQAAITRQSMGPAFVLVTIVNRRSGDTQTGCDTSNTLIGAVHREYQLPYTAEGNAKALSILSTPSHRFQFSRPEALSNMHVSEPADEDWIRAQYGLSDREAVLAKMGEKLKARDGNGLLVTESRDGKYGIGIINLEVQKRRNALACVLIQYGFRVYMAAEAGNILGFE